MRHRQLKRKPLVEAILEIRWELLAGDPGAAVDPHYKLLLGRLFDRVQDSYPAYEELPTASFPDQLIGHQVQHRFRVAPGAWPLVQVGPGIFTLNSTGDYTSWGDFRARALAAKKSLFEAYPRLSDLKTSQVVLRYINAVDFDYTKNGVFEFLQSKMGVQVSLPSGLFSRHSVSPFPPHFSWESSFLSSVPEGNLLLRFATGQREKRPSLVWETTFDSKDHLVPGMEDGFEAWLDGAHQLIDDCFFELIKGDLEKEFDGE